MARLCKRCCEIAEFASSTEGDVCTNCGKFESDGTEFTAEVERNAAGQQYGTFVSDTGRVAGACLSAVMSVDTIAHYSEINKLSA